MEPTRVRRPWTPPTLRDLAGLTQVSLATASRALASAAEGSLKKAPLAAEQVANKAREIGYFRPREVGRLLAFTSEVTRTGYWETLSGINDVARERDLETTIVVISGSPENRRRTFELALQRRVDGAVLLEFDSPSVEILDHVPKDLPFAIAGGYPDPNYPLPRAWIDDFAGAVRATEYLVSLQHRRIGFVGLPPAGHPDPRVQGWRHVLQQEGLEEVPQLGTGWSAETGRRAAAGARKAGVTAVLCGNDDLAFGVISGLTRMGVRVPDEVSVMGMDDQPLSAAAAPSLTTIRLDFAQIGRIAAKIALGDELDHVVNGAVEVGTRVIIRDSTSSASV